jgi:hypothetical protein
MTEEANTTTELSALETLRKQVRSGIQSSIESVREELRMKLVRDEAERRVNDLAGALGKLDKAEQELRKIKMDHRVCDENGATIQQGYAPETAKKLQEAKQFVAKIESAIELALTKGDFSKVRELK